MFGKLKSAILNHKIIVIILILILAVGGYYAYQKYHKTAEKISYITDAVTKTTISSSVTGTGQISELKSMDLQSSGSGKIIDLKIKAGDQVKADQVLATIDQKDNLNSIKKAKANLISAQANYQEVLAGSTSSELKNAQNSVNQAQTSYNNAVISLENKKASAASDLEQAQETLTDLEDVSGQASPTNKRGSLLTTIDSKLTSVREALDSEEKVFDDQSMKDVLSAQDSSSLNNAKSSYDDGLSLLTIAQTSFSEAKSSPTDENINQSVSDTIKTLNKVYESLNYCFYALRATISSTKISQSQIDSYKSNISSQSSSMNSSVSDLQEASQALKDALTTARNNVDSLKLSTAQDISSSQASVDSATNSLQSAKDNLTEVQQPATKQSVNSSYASLISAEASYSDAQEAYNNNIIKAPFDGQISVVNVGVGDQIGSGTTIATVITNQKVAIVSLNEVDIVKIKLGQDVNLTFDAIEDFSLVGKVAQIDSVGTTSSGVVTYKVTISFDTDNAEVKPGMSVNAAIITDVKTDVLGAPNAAIKADSTGNYVQILNSAGKPEKVYVEVGVANDTYTQVTSDSLSEGDKVVTQTINLSAKASSKTTTSSSSTKKTTSVTSVISGSTGGNMGAGGPPGM